MTTWGIAEGNQIVFRDRTSTMQVPQLPPPPQFITFPCRVERDEESADSCATFFPSDLFLTYVGGVEFNLIVEHDVPEEFLAAAGRRALPLVRSICLWLRLLKSRTRRDRQDKRKGRGIFGESATEGLLPR